MACHVYKHIVIIDVLTDCTLIILYACHDNDFVFALLYSWFFRGS